MAHQKQILYNAKLTPADVLSIRGRLASGMSTVKQEADRFHVGIETIRRAARGDTYRFVEGRRADDRPIGEEDPPLGAEPTPEELARSLARLNGLAAAKADNDPDTLLEQWAGSGKK